MVRQPYPESAFLWPQFVRVEQDGSVVQQVLSATNQTVRDSPASIRLKCDWTCRHRAETWSTMFGSWDDMYRGKARDHFHKVPCVRLLDQAKKNITSIALIKAQPRWWKNNDVRATALLRTHRKKAGASNHSTLLAVSWYSPVSISLYREIDSTKSSGKWRNTLFLFGFSFKAIV